MGTWVSCLNILVHVALLFFMIPIRIDRGYVNNLDEMFKSYLAQFNKNYNKTEYFLRLKCFEKSLAEIEKLNLNRTNNSAYYGLTKFSDMLPEEFLQVNLINNLKNKKQNSINTVKRSAISLSDLPKKVDWREKNVITKIKDQRDCGACWAFAGIETLESIFAIKYGKLVDLSVQQAIDCAGYNNDGCNGGDVCNFLSWMKDYKIKIKKESDYPLTLKKDQCKINGTSNGIVEINEFICENFVSSEDIMLALLAKNGPISVAVNARSWQNYIGGVIQFHCEKDIKDLNHAVQIVGYNLNKDVPYYIVRNNWGTDFGDGGYLYIAIGNNLCGIAMEVSTLTIL